MNRIAILIGSPGSNLNGVYKDIPNIIDFLKSPMGGAWQDNEILFLGYNPDLQYLNQQIKNYQNFDFGFVYFSGHGATDKNNQSIIAINQNEQIFVDSLANIFKKQVTIIDACRGYQSDSISGIGNFDFDFERDERLKSASRHIFNTFLHNSPQGRILLFASQEGQNVKDSEQGGIFSINLLKSARGVSHNSDQIISTLNEVYYDVKKRMSYTTIYQPEFINPNQIFFPFVVNVQNFRQNIVPYNYNVPVKKEKQDYSNVVKGGLIILGAIGIGAWIADVINKR